MTDQGTSDDARADFEHWLADMDDALERFFQRLPAEVGTKLDFSPGSLDALEGWILEKHASTDDLLKENTRKRLGR